jgi:DNA repair protein RecN (Recombination protein N)
MLTHLRIHNIILIETAEIPFSIGFNVLSGETGSGKSAILNSLYLITGERADASLVRRGTEKGFVEASFDIANIQNLNEWLDNAGITHHAGEELIIRRELSSSGKSRAFINSQQVQLSILKEISAFLIEMVGQHANQKLLSIDNHRIILDTFEDLQSDLNSFSKTWTEENHCRSQIHNMQKSEAQRLRDIDTCLMELEELKNGKLKEGEDEELFSEYTLLNNSEELASKADELCEVFSGERQAVLPILNKYQQTFAQLVKIDPSLMESAKAYNNALIELNEVAHTLRLYRSRLEFNPNRLQTISDRLSAIDKLKRRYGKTVLEIQQYEKATKEKFDLLQNCDAKIDELKQQLDKLEKVNAKQCQKITDRRKKAAIKLEEAVVAELKTLNMDKAQFHCVITPQSRTHYGDDRIEFFLTPNVGEHRIPIKECASGGELSRLMLALQALLAGKTQIPTLIFDEIDSNIGGETAVVVGEKLKGIGKKHQVICITHFPQVAKEAQHHLQIAKKELEGRTVTFVTLLDPKMRKQELMRMLGGKSAKDLV